MKENMFKFKVGGRTSEQTFTNAMTLLKYIDELQPNKMYGIMKAGKSITLLTKNEVISKSKVKEKKEELDKEEKRELKGTKGQDRYYIKQKYMYKRKVLEELLREE